MSDALSRYQARHQQLSRGASSVGGTLEAAGDLLRRSSRVGAEGVEPALRSLTRPQIETWLQSQKPAELRSQLLKAAEEAVEVALGEGGEEAELVGEGRMCLPPMMLHPVKQGDLVFEHQVGEG